jgi:hypothetical protein
MALERQEGLGTSYGGNPGIWEAGWLGRVEGNEVERVV